MPPLENKVVTFDRPMLERLKTAYQQAVAVGRDRFSLDGNEYRVGYAKYVIEYLEPLLPR